MLGNGRKKGPCVAGGGATGGEKVVAPIIAAPHESGKPAVWPKPDNPFFHQLRLDRNYVWDRMMASVYPEGCSNVA